MRHAKRLYRGMATIGVAVALVAASASIAAAFSTRVPQVPVAGGTLQGYLNGVGESINVLTDQVDGQVWTASISGNATFTLMIEFTGSAAGNAIGVYNTADPPAPPLFQIFPGAASAGWFATAHFGGGNLVVTLFDQNSIIQARPSTPA